MSPEQARLTGAVVAAPASFLSSAKYLRVGSFGVRAIWGSTILLSFLVLLRVAFGEPLDRSFLTWLITAAVTLGILALLAPLLVKWCAAEDRMWQEVGHRLRRFANRIAKSPPS
jgi:hypothetical protein